MFSTQASNMILCLALIFQTLLYCGKSWQIITSRPVEDVLNGVDESQARISDKTKKLTALRDSKIRACFINDYDPFWELEQHEREEFLRMASKCSPIQIEKLKAKAGEQITDYCKRRLNIIWLNQLDDSPPPALGSPRIPQPSPLCEYTEDDDSSTNHRNPVPPGALNNGFLEPPTRLPPGPMGDPSHHTINTDNGPPPLGNTDDGLIPPPLSNNLPQAQLVAAPRLLDISLDHGPPSINTGKDELLPPPKEVNTDRDAPLERNALVPIVSQAPKTGDKPLLLGNPEGQLQGTPRPMQIRMQETVEGVEGRYFVPQIGNTATPPPPPELLRLLLMNGAQRNAAAPRVEPGYPVPEDPDMRTPPAPAALNRS
ncbi:basic salivary proline-rich protein 2-like [Dreissena polymorpha]|uniref:Uncharacterized protein n=1 Tax=Dreissena polymorpha TaxID=45954 RepID=A0A9D4JFR5_DREPO|nr:basic salivary proline-rich protein 2-like [Dreissena polymorpha]KAH3810185.1 hypothetical protein DPMN_138574 [Dreissena polymorpha]